MRKENGITLISLVVTIIVLIILAGVSINLILGQDGIITKAKEAKQNMELAADEEARQLNELYDQMTGESSGSLSYDAIAKLVEFKREIASAITDMGVSTSEEADAETMASNIRSLTTNVDTTADYYYSGYSGSTGSKTYTKEFVATKTGTLIVDINAITSNTGGDAPTSSSCTKNDEAVELTTINSSVYHRKYAIIPYESGDVIVATGTCGSTSNGYAKGICIMFYDISQ